MLNLTKMKRQQKVGSPMFITRLMRDDGGATAVEYGLMAALMSIAAIVGMKSLGVSVNGFFTSVVQVINDGLIAAGLL